LALLVAAGSSLQDWWQREGGVIAASGASPTVAPSGLPSVLHSFTSRTELTACGAIDTVTSTPSAITDAWTCLDQAISAELIVTTTTEEGDQIVSYYRVSPDIDGLEIFRDATADTFASPEDRRWSHQECPGTVSVNEPLNCHEV
ncbi:MAG: hypothetical protein HGA51_06085, partial [Demequinaceae bacterium]|nr:hypothetical protein [Demequinaceae bacterium]